jgi:hypothetical protein
MSQQAEICGHALGAVPGVSGLLAPHARFGAIVTSVMND